MNPNKLLSICIHNITLFQVNDLLLCFPTVLSQGKVRLYMNGFSKSVETRFGVFVTLSSNVLTVQMPGAFSSYLCGLCGNLNVNPDDDGDADISQAMTCWQTNTEHACVDEPLNSSHCDTKDMACYPGNDFCGCLLDPDSVSELPQDS